MERNMNNNEQPTYRLAARHYTFKNKHVPDYWVAYLYEMRPGYYTENVAAIARAESERRAIAVLRLGFPEAQGLGYLYQSEP
jgi:hypothetical protein